MGDPKKQRKKFEGPRHPWEAERIKEEKEILKEYGLKNKKELWKMNSILKKIKARAKKIIANKGNPEIEKEKEIFLKNLCKYNYITPTSKIEDVLDMKITDILERRLQTQLLRKDLTKTIKQSRQFIVHGHILVNNKKMDVPSYLISKDEEFNLTFSPNSTLIKEDHPERVSKKEEIKTQLKITKETENKKEEKVKETEKEKPVKEKTEEEVKEKPKDEKVETKESTKEETKETPEKEEDKKTKEIKNE